MQSPVKLQEISQKVKQCTLCAKALPLGPRPVFQVGDSTRLMIIGQAPGIRVHETGIPWNDPSGDRLRDWLQLDKPQFYDTSNIAIMSMGFCYPGRGSSGDLPPRPECAPQWHKLLLEHMPNIELTLLIGQYAQNYYLQARQKTLTAIVRHYLQSPEDFGRMIPLPHPSPRNNRWLRNNPWFETKLIPLLRQQVAGLFSSNQNTITDSQL